MIVKYLPLQPHCFAFGGFDIQMIGSSAAINNCGVEISKLDIWNRDSNFDILHCWGLSFSHYENYIWAKKAGKKLVATILMHDHDTIYEKLRFKLSVTLFKQKFIKEMLELPDKIIVVNENQANLCHYGYNVPFEKISVIPNLVSENFISAASKVKTVKNEDYVLTVGNICQRKNQLALAKACINENVRLVIVGKILDGEGAYGSELTSLMKKNADLITWIPELKENSPELINYYLNCAVFALPSFIEQQPISLLEAAVLQKPLLAANKIYASQKYYRNICKVDPNSISSIGTGIKNVLQNPQNYIVNDKVLQECTWTNVGESYKKVYTSLFL